MEIIITIKIDEDKVVDTKVDVKEVDEPKETESYKYSPYARWFDECCTQWSNIPEFNLMFLKHQQNYANELLKTKGYLFLNEVYVMLGIPRTKVGQVVGWHYDEEHPTGDNRVDFGIFNDDNRQFVNGYEKPILLDFNVDGNIMDYLKEEGV